MKIRKRIEETPSQTNYLCLDVALANLGVSVYQPFQDKFCFYDVFVTKGESKKKRHTYANEISVRRCQEITFFLDSLCCRFLPSYIFAELPTGGGISSSAVSAMALATATIATFSALKKITLLVVQPNEIKRCVKNKGSVSKEDVIAFVRKRYKLPKRKDVEHIADSMMTVEVLKKTYPSLFISGRSLDVELRNTALQRT